MKSLLRLLLLSCWLLPSGSAWASAKPSYQHYLKALLLSNQGEYKEALQEFEAALKLDPQSAFLCQQAAELALSVGQTDRALDLVTHLLELSPGSADAWHLAGNIRWARGEAAEAQKAFEKALELQPGHQTAMFALGNLLSSQSPERAKKYFLDYIAANPDDRGEAEYHIALLEQKAGRNDEAIAHYRAAIQADPQYMEPRFGLAQLYEVGRATDAAIAEYLVILKYDAGNVMLLNHVGEMYFSKGDIENARRLFLQAKETVPSHPATCLWLALIAEQENDYAAAVDYLKSSAALAEDPGLSLRLSYYLTQANRLPEAVKILEGAHRQWADNEEISYFLALGYDDLHEPKKAVELMKQVLRFRPDHRDALFQLGSLYEKLGDLAGMEAAFRELMRLQPNDASALNYLGYSLADRGLKLDEAEPIIRRAVELDPGNGAYLDSLGWVHFKQGRLGDAVAELKTAARRLPEDDAIWDHLGEVYSVLGDTTAAWTSWKRAQLLSDGKAGIEKKLARVEDRFSPEELGRLSLDFMGSARGTWERYGGPCAIEGTVGPHPFRFQGLLQFRAPDELSMEVLGPLFIPLFRAALVGGEGFEMDPLGMGDAPPEQTREALLGALRFLRRYMQGELFRSRPAESRKSWRKAWIETPELSFFLEEKRMHLGAVETLEKERYRLELSGYRFVEGRWVPETLKIDGRGFSLTFHFSSPPSVRFE
ncbi:MAG: hypothetical protein A2X36_11840 [Elusimicrobia bacterium GWA2_69_24]|nr:MAG: hypothetical protein A2X36_11840 [Elusimicrobia bacterium GWA2_69_24]HBL16318.1 hypothetical protein [Elusimicrobiota bacterium]